MGEKKLLSAPLMVIPPYINPPARPWLSRSPGAGPVFPNSPSLPANMTTPSDQGGLSQYYTRLGTAYYKANRLHHAIRAFDEALRLNGLDYQTYNKRGVAKAGLKDYPGAFADYTQALAIRPDFYNAYTNRGNLWVYLGEVARQAGDAYGANMHFQCALTDYGQAIRLNPFKSSAYENRSELYSSLGMKNDALRDKAAVIRLRKMTPVSRNGPINRQPRIALVLANDDYVGTENDLNGGPIRDASGISTLLRGEGFRVLEGVNLSGSGTRAKVAEFASLLHRNPQAVSLIYYSGHGGSINGNNYLIPVDFSGSVDPSFERDAVSVDYLLKELKSSNTYFNMIFLDACRTPLVNNRTFSSGKTALKQWETEPGPGLSNTWIEYASRPKRPALQEGNQGLYTKYLLRYMARPDLNLKEVSMYTSYALESDPVAIREDQHARTQTDLTQTGPIAESFYFNRPAGQPGSSPARHRKNRTSLYA